MLIYRYFMSSSNKSPLPTPPFWRIALTRHVDFLLVLMPIILWAGMLYYFLCEQDPFVNQWLDDQPFWFLLPLFLTLLSLIFFVYRARYIHYLFRHGKKIKGQVIKVDTKRHFTRFFLPIKSVIAYQYRYGGKHYKRRIHLLSPGDLSAGMAIHIHIDPKNPGKGIVRDIFMDE